MKDNAGKMYCSKCKVKLNKKNTSPSNLKIRQLECRKCVNKYLREHVITRDHSKDLIGNKRPYPKNNRCELCNRIKNRLAYHHWNDNDISKGLWICPFECHIIAEVLDDDETITIRYKNLKKKYG